MTRWKNKIEIFRNEWERIVSHLTEWKNQCVSQTKDASRKTSCSWMSMQYFLFHTQVPQKCNFLAQMEQSWLRLDRKSETKNMDATAMHNVSHLSRNQRSMKGWKPPIQLVFILIFFLIEQNSNVAQGHETLLLLYPELPQLPPMQDAPQLHFTTICLSSCETFTLLQLDWRRDGCNSKSKQDHRELLNRYNAAGTLERPNSMR